MRKFVVYLSAIFILMQFFQIERTVQASNPTKEISANPEVKAILKRACYDCHSNETKYPMYSYVAPISWAVASNIKNARRAMNFSIWEDMDAKVKEMRVERFEKVLKNKMMPKAGYLLFHEEAELKPNEIKILVEWVNSELKSSKKL